MTAAKKPKGAAASKAAAAAAEVSSNGHKDFTFEGLKLTIPAKMPFAVVRYLTEKPGPAEIVGVLETILGDQVDQVWAAGFDIEQGTELMEALVATYGSSLGESPALQTS